MKKTCVIIAGPTASGKTAVAIALATHFNTSIISADSRQCYREMNIGVAKPTPEELRAVPHYFIDTHAINQEVTAAGFESYALETASRLFQEDDIIVMAGGTGLYIKAFTDGIDPIPAIDASVRAEISKGYHDHGINWLQDQIRLHDPIFATRGEMQNPVRIMRALEVVLSTHTSILEFQTGKAKQRDFDILTFALQWPREKLYERINERVEQMMQLGQEEEARQLYPHRHLKALQTVGYQELFRYIDGEIERRTAIELIKQNTRNYAKRQVTWFKKNPGTRWIDGTDLQAAVHNIIHQVPG